jgi:hypothetical protein
MLAAVAAVVVLAVANLVGKGVYLLPPPLLPPLPPLPPPLPPCLKTFR